MIHPTAIIDSGAKIGRNVEVGRHSIISSAVSIGDESIIGANVVIEGEVIQDNERSFAERSERQFRRLGRHDVLGRRFARRCPAWGSWTEG